MADDHASALVGSLVAEGLVGYEPGTARVTPRLAERWEVSGDGATWAFHLRAGARFHDGSPVDAAAVLANLRRWSDRLDTLHGGRRYPYWNDFMLRVVQRFTSPAPGTVVVVLSESRGDFLANLALPAFAIASPAALVAEGEDYGRRPVGSGPYRVAAWPAGGPVDLVANAGYWGGAPRLAALRFVAIADDQERLRALREGAIQGLEVTSPALLAGVEGLPGVRLWPRPPLTLSFLGFNLRRRPLDDVRVRRAIVRALDRGRAAQLGFGFLARPASQTLPAAAGGSDEAPPGPDAAAARLELEAAGLPQRQPIELWYPPIARPWGWQPRQEAQSLAGDLERVGLHVSLRTEEFAAYVKDTISDRFQLYLLGWFAESGDPDSFWSFLAPEPRPGAARGAWQPPEARSLLARARREVDPAARAASYARLEALAQQDVPWVPLAHPTSAVALTARAHGFVPSPTGNDDFSNVTLDE